MASTSSPEDSAPNSSSSNSSSCSRSSIVVAVVVVILLAMLFLHVCLCLCWLKSTRLWLKICLGRRYAATETDSKQVAGVSSKGLTVSGVTTVFCDDEFNEEAQAFGITPGMAFD